MTAQIRQNRKTIAAPAALPVAFFFLGANQTIPNGVETNIVFGGWESSIGATHVSLSSGSVSIKEGGWYAVTMSTAWSSAFTTGRRFVRGDGAVDDKPATADTSGASLAWMDHYYAGALLSNTVTQDSGSSLDLTMCNLQIVKLNSLDTESR